MFHPPAGLWVGTTADLGDRLLTLPEQPMPDLISRTHLVTPLPTGEIRPGEFELVQRRLLLLERSQLELAARLAMLEAPGWLRRRWIRMQAWWRRQLARMRKD